MGRLRRRVALGGRHGDGASDAGGRAADGALRARARRVGRPRLVRHGTTTAAAAAL